MRLYWYPIHFIRIEMGLVIRIEMEFFIRIEMGFVIRIEMGSVIRIEMGLGTQAGLEQSSGAL